MFSVLARDAKFRVESHSEDHSEEIKEYIYCYCFGNSHNLKTGGLKCLLMWVDFVESWNLDLDLFS